MAKKRVVITGLSAITSYASGIEELWKQLCRAECIVKSVPVCYQTNHAFHSGYFTPFPDISGEDYGIAAKYEPLMENNARIATACAAVALTDAGLKSADGNVNVSLQKHTTGAGIVIGMGMNSLQTAFSSFVHHVAGHRNYPDFDGCRFNRMVIPMTMPNSVAAWISMLFGIKGEAYTINASCASGNYAIGQAFGSISSGRSSLMICGGVECLKDDHGAIMRGFDMLGALTCSTDGKPEPFSLNRSGFLFSEGAGCVLILEELGHAQKRDAKIYAEIVACGFNSDSHNIVQMEESGSQIIRLLKKLVKNVRIDYINAHGTGTVNNDRVEAAIIKKIFGHKGDQPMINSTKSIIGHTIGASAAIETAVTALSLRNGIVHPTLTSNIIDDVNVVTAPVEADLDYALNVSYGFGGHNSAVLLKKYSSDVDKKKQINH